MTTLVVTSYFEEEHVRRIREVDGRLRVLYREDLVPPPRWPGTTPDPRTGGARRSKRRSSSRCSAKPRCSTTSRGDTAGPDGGRPEAPLAAGEHGRRRRGGEEGRAPGDRRRRDDRERRLLRPSGRVRRDGDAPARQGPREAAARQGREDVAPDPRRHPGGRDAVHRRDGQHRARHSTARGPFGMRVVGVKRTVREDDPPGVTPTRCTARTGCTKPSGRPTTWP